MQIAVALYDRFTALDAVGPYQVLTLIPGAEVIFVAEQAGPVRNEMRNLGLVADAAISDVSTPDIVVVPGAPDTTPGRGEAMLEWLRAVDQTTTWTTSVCTGSLILAAAGLLRGRSATSHWLVTERLREFGAEPSPERVVVDGRYATAAGVSAGIDLALTLAGRIAGPPVAQAIQLAIEYDPHPPFAAGSPARAPAEVIAGVRALLGGSVTA
jgi:transcriptional regulator GlxA family with amidase domain